MKYSVCSVLWMAAHYVSDGDGGGESLAKPLIVSIDLSEIAGHHTNGGGGVLRDRAGAGR